MSSVSAQVSVYPLRRLSIGEPIDAVLRALSSAAVEVSSGPMSTMIVGPEAEVFNALGAGFRAACSGGDAVMVVTLSNACLRPDGAGASRAGDRNPGTGRTIEEE